jgi:NAD-dependent deacetylase
MTGIVILTGAGVSAESGLGTFRDTDGLWARHDLNEVATPQGFARNPARVHDFYNARRALCRAAQPNAAHLALARLQAARPDVTLITQNVDDLHARAGSVAIQMHGTLMGALCGVCDHRWQAPGVMQPEDPCPACARPATRPDVVWFGEIPYHLDEIAAVLDRADMFVAIGTSGQVWPATGFVETARAAGARTLEMNLTPSAVSDRFDATRLGRASLLVPHWVDDILRG